MAERMVTISEERYDELKRAEDTLHQTVDYHADRMDDAELGRLVRQMPRFWHLTYESSQWTVYSELRVEYCDSQSVSGGTPEEALRAALKAKGLLPDE